MDMASIVQNKVIIMFVMLLIGVLCAKIGIIDEATNRKLSSLSLMLVSPLLIFASYQIDYSLEMVRNLGISFVLSVVCFAIEILFSHALISAKKSASANIERIAMVYSNCGFIGIPLAESLYGKEGVFYITVYITVFNLLLWTHGVILMTGKAGGLKQMLKNLCTPTIFAILLGLVCFLTRLRLPNVLLEPIEAVGGMNTPLAMLVAGSTLAHADLLSCLRHRRIYVLSAIKLLLIPAAAVLATCWMPFEPMLLMLPILSTACPTGASGTMFALRYDGDSALASQIFAVTTALSIVTIPLIVRLCAVTGIL
ncbi:MAG: AEC family transporter [Clostridia bacterium]|nr:AEC family transporter [Clostridia bacterium]